MAAVLWVRGGCDFSQRHSVSEQPGTAQDREVRQWQMFGVVPGGGVPGMWEAEVKAVK